MYLKSLLIIKCFQNIFDRGWFLHNKDLCGLQIRWNQTPVGAYTAGPKRCQIFRKKRKTWSFMETWEPGKPILSPPSGVKACKKGFSVKFFRTFQVTETAFQTGSFDLRRIGLCSFGSRRGAAAVSGDFELLWTLHVVITTNLEWSR